MEIALAALAFVALPAALAFAAVALVRRLVPRRATGRDPAEVLFGVAGGAYGVLLSFLVVVAWQGMTEASAVAEGEVGHLGTAWNLLDGFEAPAAWPMRRAIVAYGRAVVEDEWPRLADGQGSERAWDAYAQLWRALLALEPAAGADHTLYAHLVGETRAFSDARRLRLADAQGTFPAELWAVLLAGGAVTLLFACLLGGERPLMHGLLTALLAALLGLVLFLIAALDNPWRGPVKLEPTSFRTSLAFWEAQPPP